MSPIEISRPVNASAERVWEILTDLDGSPARLSAIDQVERVSGPEFGVGTRWRETRTMFNKQTTEELEVTAVEPGRAYTVGAESNGAVYESVLSVEPTGESDCTVAMTFDAEPQTTHAKLMTATIGRAFKGATRKALAKDLDEIAAAAEG